MFSSGISRRRFLRSTSFAAAGLVIPSRSLFQNGMFETNLLHTNVFQKSASNSVFAPLEQFDYSNVEFANCPHEEQLEQTHSVLHSAEPR
jgi:hypothetical protein